MLARPQRALLEHDSPPGCHGDDDVRGERVVLARGDAGPELGGDQPGALLVDVPELHLVRPRAMKMRAAARPFTPAPITAAEPPATPSVSAASTAAAPVRSAVTAPASSIASTRPVRRVREEDDPAHRRQALLGIARETT